MSFTLTDRVFELRRSLILVYAALALVLSCALLLLSLRRGLGEFSLWLIVYLGIAVLSLRRPQLSVLAAGTLGFLVGFAKTHRHGYNLDLGLSLIALAVGVHGALRMGRGKRTVSSDLAGVSLLLIAALSLISLGFAVVRIRSFAPAPGFSYHTYPFSSFRMSSDEAIIRAIIGATATFTWFGLYAYARAGEVKRETLGVVVFLILLVNSSALLVQSHLDTGFLHPAGQALADPRENGVTSYCYALGDALLALYLLLPFWGSWRGVSGVRTVGSLLLLTHGVVASGSRTALLTMLSTAFLWGGLQAVRLSRGGRRLAATVSLVTVGTAVAVAIAAYRMTPPDQATPFGRLKYHVEQQGLLGHLFSTRLTSYPLMLRVMTAYPLSGVGAGLFSAEAGKQRALLAPNLQDLDPFLLTSYAPNQFLNTGVELGLPALIGLVVVFAFAGAAVLSRREREGSRDLAVSLLALTGALQMGPAFYNSEALVFFWLVIGGAAGPWPDSSSRGPKAPGSRVAAVLLAGGMVLGIVGQLLARPSLAVDRQWQRLRWRLTIGMQPPEPGGRWAGPEATFVVDTPAPAVIVRWHAGDRAAPDYRAEVTFYVDGVEVEKSLALPGRIRESALPLPAVAGFKRISVRVSPPFVPAEMLGGSDRRRLGVFIHTLSPLTRNAVPARAPAEDGPPG